MKASELTYSEAQMFFMISAEDFEGALKWIGRGANKDRKNQNGHNILFWAIEKGVSFDFITKSVLGIISAEEIWTVNYTEERGIFDIINLMEKAGYNSSEYSSRLRKFFFQLAVSDECPELTEDSYFASYETARFY